MWNMLQRTFVVTGANGGIGRAVCLSLLQREPNAHVCVCARRLSDAQETCKSLGGTERTSAHEVELTDTSSISAFVKGLPQFDVLINNAGFAEHGDAFDETVARKTIGPNFFGTRELTYAVLAADKVREGGRIVNVTSAAGLFNVYSPELQQRLLNATDEDLTAMANEFYASVADGTFEQRGFCRSTYRVSKALANAWSTRILPRHERVVARKLLVAAVHPGFVQTKMSSYRGDRTAEQGAEPVVWAALAPAEQVQQGKYWHDKEKTIEL